MVAPQPCEARVACADQHQAVTGRLRRLTAALGLVVALTAGACTSGGGEVTSAASTTAAATSAPSLPSTPTTPQLTPLTGGPVLAVKIDNTSPARPRIGLERADVVYVEPVEAGYTRLLAVFTSTIPPEAGPVRSARESDLEMLGNYGRVAFAFSGASAYTLGILATGPQVNLSNDASRQGFHRDAARPAPYNLVGDSGALLGRAGGSAPPADIGFRFGPSPQVGASATSLDTAYGHSSVSFQWDATRHQYLLSTDGRPDLAADGGQVGASSVIVQSVAVRDSDNRDVNGIATPVASLLGQGNVTVVRDGQQWSGQWSRPALASPTSLQTADGRPITLAATPVWVLLVPQSQPVTVR